MVTDERDIDTLRKLNALQDTLPSIGLKMKTGQMSRVIEAENGYYVLYCVSDFDEEATRQKKEEMIEEEQEDVFSEIVIR